MSVSLVTLRLEIAADYPLLPHLHYKAQKLINKMDSSKSENLKNETSPTHHEASNVNETQTTKLDDQEKGAILRKHRGSREMKEYTIETYKSSSEKGVKTFSRKCSLKSSNSSKESTPELNEAKCSREDSFSSQGATASVSERKLHGSKANLNQLQFYSGNHFIEVTKGILHLYKENKLTPLSEEAERSELICILAVSASLTLHDLLQFIAPVHEEVENIRIIRDNKPNQYMVLLKFRNQKSADEFYDNYNGVPFNSIEPELCHLVFVAQVETVKETEDACLPIPGQTELPTCTVCLERMDESVQGVLTILCNHSFHSECLEKWGDTSCPICRYCQTPELIPDNRCFECGAQQDSLWICLVCGHIGCGRYVEGHAYKHYCETQHTYAMQLGNNRVWDYAGDNYVHRLLQNKDGKPVEVECNNAIDEEKIDAVQLEYTYLLTNQLEAQRHYFEETIHRIEKDAQCQIEEILETNRIVTEERDKLVKRLDEVSKDKQNQEKKINQLTVKLNKALVELQEERELNKCLRENQQAWQQKVKDTEKQINELKTSQQKEVSELKEQIRDLMFYLETREKLKDVSETTREEIANGQIVVSPSEANTSKKGKGKKR